MPEVRFDFDWHDGEGIEGAELSATFASLRIDIRNQPVTRVFDSRARTVRDSVYVPLYPLAEWLVANWWFLSYEFENPTKKGTLDFSRRHALGTNTDGYAFPDLVVVSSGTRTRFDWGSSAPPPWTRVEFLDWGQASVDTEEFREVSTDLIDRVIRRLVAFDIHDTFLQEEWAAIRGADDEESSFCETAAGLGWDPYELDDSKRNQVLMLADELGQLRGEAVPVMDASAPLEESSAIASALKAAKLNGLQLLNLRPLIENKGVPVDYPWEAGYEFARQARRGLGLDGQPIRTLELLASALGEDVKSLEQVTRPIASLDRVRLVDGVVTGGDGGSVSFGLRRTGEHGRRFLFCRALAEAISSDGDALITRGHTERQQRNRAFAAEFLAPSSSLRERISAVVVDGEEVDDLAEEFGVSTRVVLHQIDNHKIAQVAEG